MKKTNWVTIVSLFLIIALALAACSGGNSKPNNDETPPASSSPSNNEGAEEQAEETPAAEGEKFDLNGREIVFSAWWDGTPNADTPEGELALQRQKLVEEKYNVKIKYVAQDYWQTAEKLSSTVLAGEPYADVVLVPDPLILGLLSGGYFTALDDFMDVGSESRLAPNVIHSGSYNQDKVYGFLASIPLFDNTGLFYNKRIFQEAGLKTPTQLQAEGSWNWDAFIETARALTLDKDGDGQTDQWGISVSPSYLGLNMIYSNDVMVYNEAEQKFNLDDPKAIEALDMMHKLYNEYKVVKQNEGDNWNDPSRYFTEGKIAMYPGGVWEAGSRLRDVMTDEFSFVHFPKGPKATDHIVGLAQMHMNFIPKGVENPKAVYMIWEDLQNWDVEESTLEAAESYFTDEESINTALAKFSILKFGRYGGLGVGDHFDPLAEDIAAGKVTPATGVAQIMPALQANVDRVLNGAE